MKLPILVCSLAFVGLSRPSHAQAGTAPSAPASIARMAARDCLARMANVPGRGTSTIETVRLQPNNPMPGFLPSAPRRVVISVVVDTAGRADLTTLQVPPELDSAGVYGIRTVLPAWRFSPARVAGCPVKQVVRVTFTR